MPSAISDSWCERWPKSAAIACAICGSSACSVGASPVGAVGVRSSMAADYTVQARKRQRRPLAGPALR